MVDCLTAHVDGLKWYLADMRKRGVVDMVVRRERPVGGDLHPDSSSEAEAEVSLHSEIMWRLLLLRGLCTN